jgi:hypothetical protein
MKKNSLVILFISFLLAIPLLTSCDPSGYKGPYAELFTVTSNSILGVMGDDDHIVPMEEDSYGRRMFFQWGKSIASEKEDDYGFWAIVICQKTDTTRKYTYFYPEVNYMLYKVSFPDEKNYVGQYGLLKEIAYTLATEEELNDFKKRNDWDKPFNETKCSKVKVSRAGLGIEKNLIPRNKENSIYNKLQPGTSRRDWHFEYLTSDSYGRHIYFFQYVGNVEHVTSYLLMLFPGGTYHYVEIKDPWNFQDELKTFKDNNSWEIAKQL